jgi:hypothetical protein
MPKVSEWLSESFFSLSRKSLVADLKVPTCWEESILFQCLHSNENPFMYSFSGELRGIMQSRFPTFMCLWAIYIFPGSVHIFPAAE